MNVKDGLPGVGARVEHKTEVTIRVVCGELTGEGDQFGEQAGVAGCEFGDIAVLLGLGDHEQVDGRLRCDVSDREQLSGGCDDLTGNVTVEDSGEDRGFRHVSSLRGAGVARMETHAALRLALRNPWSRVYGALSERIPSAGR